MPAVFVSHASTDDRFISDLHDRLERETGVEIWVDHEDIKTGEEWQVKLDQALYDCPYLIVALSRQSVKRIEVIAEWRMAMTYHHAVLPVIIDDVPVEDIPSRLHMHQWVNLHTDPDGGFKQLAAAIKGGGSADGDGPRFTPWPILSRAPIERELIRIPIQGRDGDLTTIKRLLADGPTAIVGVGGLGKSRLAAEIVMTYEGIGGSVWHRCGGGFGANDVIDLLREHFGLPAAAQRGEVLNHLRSHRRLIVFDNGESLAAGSDERRQYAQMVEDLAAHHAPVLMTSRVEWNEIKPPRRKHTPAQLSPEDAAKVVLEMVKAYGLKIDLSQRAGEIARAARCHPRLIEWAVRLMEHNPIDDVIADFERLQGSDVEEALREMIHQTFEQMVSTPEGPTAAAALKCLVVCAGDFTQEAAVAITGLERDDLRPALRALQTYCYVTFDQNRQRYSVDPLVREVIDADSAADARHFDFYEALHGDHETNNNEDHHPRMTADLDNMAAALRWGYDHVPERACDWLAALQYYLDLQALHELRGELLHTALQAAQAAGYAGGEANTLKALGDLSVRLAELTDAKAYYDRALPIYDGIGARLGQANTLIALGDLSVRLDELTDAKAYYDRALPIYDGIGARLGQANTLKALGDLSVRLDELTDAKAYYDRALPIYDGIGDRLGQANTLKALGDLSVRLDELTDAKAYYDRALPIYDGIGARLGQANTLIALGDLSVRLDELTDAKAYYDRALPIYDGIGDRLGQANTLIALGDLSVRLAELTDAKAYYDRALPIYDGIGDRLGQANTLKALGDLSVRLDELTDAKAYYDRALPIYDGIGDRLGQANTLKALGDLSVRLDELTDAKAYYDRALPIYDGIGDRLGQANTLKALGDLSVRLDELTDAKAYYDRALPIYDGIGDRLGQANTLIALGDLYQQQEQWQDAFAEYEMAITLYTEIKDAYSLAVTRRRMAPTLVALQRLEDAIRGIRFAEDVYTRIGLKHYLPLIYQSMREVRAQVDSEAFDAAWQAVTDEALPDWLREDS